MNIYNHSKNHVRLEGGYRNVHWDSCVALVVTGEVHIDFPCLNIRIFPDAVVIHDQLGKHAEPKHDITCIACIINI